MEHIPVLLKECIDGLNIKPEGTYVDGTLGRAGHSKEIVKRLTTGKLIAIDRDMKAIEEAGENLKEYKDKIIYVHSNFSRIGEILQHVTFVLRVGEVVHPAGRVRINVHDIGIQEIVQSRKRTVDGLAHDTPFVVDIGRIL